MAEPLLTHDQRRWLALEGCARQYRLAFEASDEDAIAHWAFQMVHVVEDLSDDLDLALMAARTVNDMVYAAASDIEEWWAAAAQTLAAERAQT